MTEKTVIPIEGVKYALSAPSVPLMESAFFQMQYLTLLAKDWGSDTVKVDVEGSARPVARISTPQADGSYKKAHIGFYVMDGLNFTPYDELVRTRDLLMDELADDDVLVPHYRVVLDARCTSHFRDKADVSIDVLLARAEDTTPQSIASNLVNMDEGNRFGYQAQRILESLCLNFGVLERRGMRDAALIHDAANNLMAMLEKYRKASEPEESAIMTPSGFVIIPGLYSQIFLDKSLEVQAMIDQFLPHANIAGAEKAFSLHFDFYDIPVISAKRNTA